MLSQSAVLLLLGLDEFVLPQQIALLLVQMLQSFVLGDARLDKDLEAGFGSGQFVLVSALLVTTVAVQQ